MNSLRDHFLFVAVVEYDNISCLLRFYTASTQSLLGEVRIVNWVESSV